MKNIYIILAVCITLPFSVFASNKDITRNNIETSISVEPCGDPG